MYQHDDTSSHTFKPYTTSALMIGIVLQVPSVFLKPVTMEVFPVCDVMPA